MNPRNRFLGGPSCFIGENEVPYMCAWSENGSMTSEILNTIVETLDILQVFDGSSGINPFILLDGHGSGLSLPFLRNINSTGNIWFACIGVPYGTSLSQVGDSVEQRESYKSALTEMKKRRIAHKTKLMMTRLTIEVNEIMILINA